MKITIFFTLILSIFAVSACQTASTETASNVPSSAAQNEIKQISVEQAKNVVDAKEAQFIDVRTTGEYSGVTRRKRSIFRSMRWKKIRQNSIKPDLSMLFAKPEGVRKKARRFCKKPVSRISTTLMAERRLGKARVFRRRNKMNEIYRIGGFVVIWLL